ncbi:hypothetical protein BDZ89DRAFT_1054664 [Hymenopellis radicata]|nr:hypothetical protein BDZ89DRAFT_1054664 [Hymenopellis radicata]
MGRDELESFEARESFVCAWAERMTPKIQAERDARKHRFDLIIEQLCATGWQKDLDCRFTKSKLRHLPVVRQSEILTERECLDILRPDLRNGYQRRSLMARPCASELNKDVASVNEAMLGMMQDRLLRLMDERGLSRDPMRRPEEQLESVRFKCTACSKGLVYPAVLTHSCGARTCHVDSRSESPFGSEERLRVLNWQEAAAHKQHDDWFLVNGHSSIAFAQKRIEVGKQQMGRDFDGTIHGAQYELVDDEVLNLREVR